MQSGWAISAAVPSEPNGEGGGRVGGHGGERYSSSQYPPFPPTTYVLHSNTFTITSPPSIIYCQPIHNTSLPPTYYLLELLWYPSHHSLFPFPLCPYQWP